MKNHDILKMSSAIRMLSAAAVTRAKSGHPGMPLGMADVATVLYSNFLKFNSKIPDWPDRDRLVFSAGHGSMLLYSILYLCGYPDITLDDIKNFRQIGSRTPGHPERECLYGVENTSGPLGQGLANGVGMALAESLMSERFGSDIVDHYTYVIAGDGCLMEGISHEACSFAGHIGLSKLIVLFDDNEVSIDGPTSLAVSDDTLRRFESYGWNTISIDAHSYDDINRSIGIAKSSSKPTLIACKSVIGKHIIGRQGLNSAHSGALSEKEMCQLAQALSWHNDDYFDVPNDIMEMWGSCSAESLYQSWLRRFNDSGLDYSIFENQIQNKDLIFDELIKLKKSFYGLNEASRVASGRTISKISEFANNFIGGSADLTGSNNTKPNAMDVISRLNFNGSYVHYGVREHLMIACMNGIEMHGGFVSYGGTFFVFTDYCRPAIRLAALMGLGCIFVMTHDSIGVGEDGPTHQPVEQLASMRAMPNLLVFRPADSVETLECWLIALENRKIPSLFVLSRQNLEAVRSSESIDEVSNKSSLGAYIIKEHSGQDLDCTIYATGSEVGLAIRAREKLETQGFGIRVVSVPCWEKFFVQSEFYREKIIKNSSLKVAVEAASDFGWERFIGDDGIFIGLKDTFGQSGPYKEVYEYFGITIDNIVNKISSRLSK